ncbi:kinesin-like protein KIF28P isoform X2 [Hydra vulgaris]|uniref:kinesin-like protein KIF28P isoform X1 n=1 Tax=Hydra vulgaris TaxID=6087 RepID=UPI001F5F3507|nr:kinesin-like protein KIF28P [Hydra vulgaris]
MSENVKVAVRVRPFNSREKERNAVLCIKMSGSSTYISNPEEPNSEPRKFAFDYSYWSHDGFEEQPNGYLSPANSSYADQKAVFSDLGEGVLSNAWKGYNCSLFAYGQTGSGKSYSMVGYGVNLGIVPVTCERLFEDISKKKSEGSSTEYQVKLSMMEIYNEQVRDLLNASTLTIKGGMKVRQDPKQGFYVDGLTMVPVASYNDINSKIEQGTKQRTVAATQMNATSSRAHTIVAINFSQKGKNEQSGQNTTKTSVINLVDLAGSERADSTGATGDRLKEGSAINQSLSCLGNVIKALADASSGKGQVLVPFRDSVLTKLLKNALGGNSKTVMIAALSPADINYEETLSTLRFADRAKSIKTSAVVNESPTDKLIRELREENARLLEQLKAAKGDPKALAALAAQLSGGDDESSEKGDNKRGIDEAEVEAMKKEMEERLKRNQEEVEQMKKTWAERLKEEEAASKLKEEELKNEHKMKKTTAHLWNLNEDPQLTNMIIHFLKPGKYHVGNKKGNPTPEILLNGLSIQKDHAVIEHDGNSNKIKIVPNKEAKVVCNGIILVDESELRHGDRILFGNNHLFVLHHPKDADLLKKKEDAKKQGKTFEEVLPTFDQAQEEIAQNSGLINYGNIGDHKDGKKSPQDLLLQEDLLKILPMINEANAMSEELDKKVAFEPVLVSPQARGEKEGRTEVKVKMRDLTNDNEWIWDKNKFINRKFIMQEMYQNFTDGYPDWNVAKEKDPFWEAPDADVLIGSVHLYLQSLAYKIELEETLAITDFKGNELGQLFVQIIPCDASGKAVSEDEFVEDPAELIGKSLYCQMKISSARGLPKKFAKGESFCSYKLYMQNDATLTSVVKNTINPDFNHQKIFTFNPVTKSFVDYLMKSPLVIDVWGKQNGEIKNDNVNVSTRQLMNQDKVSSSHIKQNTADDDERYKLLCEINTYKRRAERMNKKLTRINEYVKERKSANQTTLELSKIEAIMLGPDRKDMQRFAAAANVVLTTEKVRGKTPTSTACSLQ